MISLTYFDRHWVIDCICKFICQNVFALCLSFDSLIRADVTHTAATIYRWRSNIIYELIWSIYCINDMIQGLNCVHWMLLCFIEEVILILCLYLAIIDFVDNSIDHLLIYVLEDSHWFYEVLTHCKHILVLFVLSRKQVHRQWKTSSWLSHTWL